MRQIYTSPRPGNINRVVALLAEHGIESQVENRSNWRTQGHRRFSYQEPDSARDRWEQVWITRADDYSQARKLLLELGIEPVIRHGEELAAVRNPSSPLDRRTHIATRIRRILLLAVLVVFAVQMLRYLHVF